MAVMALLFTSCRENLMELDKGVNGPLEMTIGTPTVVVLNEHKHADNGISLSWTTGTNEGTGNAIFYTLELAKAEDDYEYFQNIKDTNLISVKLSYN